MTNILSKKNQDTLLFRCY